MSGADVCNVILNNLHDHDFKHTRNQKYMNDWISVADRLPDKYGRYLVTYDGHIVISKFYDGVPEPHFYECGVTHWMPFPELPT